MTTNDMFPIAFALAGLLGMMLAQRKTPLWVAFIALPLSLGLLTVTTYALPFKSFVLELSLVPLAVLAWCWPVLGMTVLSQELNDKSGKSKSIGNVIGGGILFLAFLPVTMVVVTMLQDRGLYFKRLAWACDGPIREVTTTPDHHDVHTLVVVDRYELVDEPLWKKAKPGQHLVKKAGSAFALLDGVRIRMVPESLHWWNDPDKANITPTRQGVVAPPS